MTGGAAEDDAASHDKARKPEVVPAAIGPGGRALPQARRPLGGERRLAKDSQ